MLFKSSTCWECKHLMLPLSIDTYASLWRQVRRHAFPVELAARATCDTIFTELFEKPAARKSIPCVRLMNGKAGLLNKVSRLSLQAYQDGSFSHL